MSIPALGLHDVVVVDGTASGNLLDGPGHLRTTPLPGNVGTSLVDGPQHDVRRAVRRDHLARARRPHHGVGAQGSVTYVVRDLRRAGDPIPPSPTGPKAGRLILATAASTGALARLHPTDVVYVDADTTKAFPSGPVYPAVPDTEKAMQRDTGALPLLVLLLALVAGLALAVSVARRPCPRRAGLAGGSTGRDRARMGGDRPGHAPPPELDVTASRNDEAETEIRRASDVCP